MVAGYINMWCWRVDVVNWLGGRCGSCGVDEEAGIGHARRDGAGADEGVQGRWRQGAALCGRYGGGLRSVRPDVVHLHSSKAGLAGRLAIRGGVPTVFQPHAAAPTRSNGLLETRWTSSGRVLVVVQKWL